MTPAEFQEQTGVSDSVVSRSECLLELLKTWQARINLVGSGTLADPWRRHFLDSAQLALLVPAGAKTIVDIGSGAGFPGLVLALLGPWTVHLIESNSRKCAFLREAARVLGLNVQIHPARVEAVTPFPADVIVARACAPLPKLLAYARPFLGPNTLCLFHKGKGFAEELTASLKTWQIDARPITSTSDPAGVILRIEGVAPYER